MDTEMPMEEKQLEEILGHATINIGSLENMRVPKAILPKLPSTQPEMLSQSTRREPARYMDIVPPLLRQANNQQYYDPSVVSLGPYYHGKNELQIGQHFKIKTLEMFVSGSDKDVGFFYTKVRGQINEVRSCYIMEVGQDDETFAIMILLDACFIINHILIILQEEQPYITTVQELGILVLGMSRRDQCLLENQIPFFILKLLIGLRYGEAVGEEKLRKYVNIMIFGRDEHRSLPKNDSKEQPLHLLEALWLLATFKPDEVQPTSSRPNSCLITCNHAVEFLLKHIGNLGKRFIWRRQSHDDEFEVEKYIHSFRSVTDLKAKGIHFRPSNSSSVTAINFKSGYFSAQLDLPRDYPCKLATVIYLNLVAFEVRTQTTYFPICDYLEFMKSLLDSPVDVKELREKKILFSCLDSDEEVVRFYKDIKFPIDRLSDAFQDVKDKIEAHYNNKAKTWLAELIHTYFQSPWKALALFGGIFVLVLSLLQTIFTIKPGSTR